MPTRSHPTPDFSGLASLYCWMEWGTFGPFLAQCRYTYLTAMRNSRRALIFGDGDGRFTARLLRINPEVTVDAVDASLSMLLALKKRVGPNSARLQTHCLDAREWQPDGTNYDLIVTHFFLDCLTTDEVLDITNRVFSATTPEAIWVVSEFAIPQSWFGCLIAAPLVSALYAAFGVLTGLRVRKLPDYSPVIESGGFRLFSRQSRVSGLLACDLWTRRI